MFRQLLFFSLKLGSLIAAVFLTYQFFVLIKIWWWIDHNPTTTSFMELRLAELRKKNPAAVLQHKWVPYAQISSHLKRALIVSEDDKFVDHEGFDWEAIQKAREKNRQKGKVVAGGSTISQQLAKNLFLSGSRTALRKGEEAIITFIMEKMMEKQRIFEIYLNVIEWGDGLFGAEAAAQHYYGVSASRLSAEQAARLAAMVPRPLFYQQHRNAPGLLRKTHIILKRMPQAEVP